MARVLTLSDLHFPAHHPRAFDFLKRLRDSYKPDIIVGLGDTCDQAAFTIKYAINPDGHSPGRELELARECVQELGKIFPELYLVESNHETRIFKKFYASGLPLAVQRRLSEIFDWPKGWEYKKDGIDIDGCHFFHGEGLNQQSWKTAHQKFRMSVVHGHVHSCAGIVFSNTSKNKLFVGNAGCMVDPTASNFDYAKNSIEKPILGTITVTDGCEPVFHHLK